MLKEAIFQNFRVKEKDEFYYLPKFRAKEWEGYSHKEYFLQKAKEIAKTPIPPVTATMFLNYFETGGNRTEYQNHGIRRLNLISLVVAQLTNPEENFIPCIIDYVWAICEETSWVPPWHNNHYYTHYPDHVNLPRFDAERSYVDLTAGYTSALLSVVYYCFEKEIEEYSPLINRRLVQCVCERVVFPILNYDDFGWMGLSAEGRMNNWNPWIVYNALFSAMSMPLEQQKRRLFLNKTFLLLDQFIQYYFPDGGCDEGPGYFYSAGGSLILSLDLIANVTDGAVNVLQQPLIQNIAQYAERSALFDNEVANFGDNGPRQSYHSHFIYYMGKKTGIQSLTEYGLRRYELEPEENELFVPIDYPPFQVMKLLFYPEMKKRLPVQYRHHQTCFLPDTMILTSRQCPKDGMGFSIGAKGGQNDESHNHNDVGQVIVYLDKKPVIIDPGSSVYTEKTFSPQRYEIPNMQSGCHNLPNINGVMQKDGKEYCAEFVDFQDSEEQTILSYDIGKAYPEEAGVDVLKRTTLLDRKKGIVTITDDYSVRRGEIMWNLMVYGEPEISGNKIKTISGCVITAEGTDTEISACYAEELDQVRVKEFWDEPIYHVTLKGTDVTVGHLTLLFEKGC